MISLAAHFPLCTETRQVNLAGNKIGYGNTDGVKALANALSVNTSLTVADLRYNELDTEVATMLLEIAKEKKISLCGIKPDQTEADFTPVNNTWNTMKSADAILLTADLAVIPSLTACNLRFNSLDEPAKQLLRDSVKDRPSFKLEL